MSASEHFIPEEAVPDPLVCHECGLHYNHDDDSVVEIMVYTREYDSNGYGSWIRRHVPVCDECYVLCHSCDEPVVSDNSINGLDGNDRCESCHSDAFSSCDNCGDSMWSDESNWSDISDRTLCDYCWREEQDEEQSNRFIHCYSHKPDAVFHAIVDGEMRVDYRPRREVPYLGFELETNIKSGAPRNARDAGAEMLVKSAPSDYIYLKDDGSISGFEIVTHPATLEAHLALFPWESLRRLANEFGHSSWRGSGAGLHVHISKDSFSKFHLGKFLQFHDKNATELMRLAGRESTYAKFGRTSDNGWGSPVKADRVRQALKKEVNSDRYVAVNLQNNKSVELRYFRGSLLPSTVKGVLEFTQSVWTYTRDVRCTNINDHKNIMWPAYREWVTAQADTYPLANQLITTRGL